VYRKKAGREKRGKIRKEGNEETQVVKIPKL
jgi:hypothetical protein